MATKPTLEERLASSLRALRKERGWTQEQAASAAGLNTRHYQKLEEGSVNATLRTLARLSEAFGVDAGKLIARRTEVRR